MLYLSDMNSRNKNLFIYTKKRSIFVERFLFCEVFLLCAVDDFSGYCSVGNH